MRLELTTSPLPRGCSTTELPGHSLIRVSFHLLLRVRAGDRARTGDIQFGKLRLYQLSYTRVICSLISWWRVVGSNHRRHKPADLQSAPFDRSGNPPWSFTFSSRAGDET